MKKLKRKRKRKRVSNNSKKKPKPTLQRKVNLFSFSNEREILT